MVDALFLVDSDEVVRKSNRAAHRLLGYTEEELIGMPFYKVLVWNDTKDIETVSSVDGTDYSRHFDSYIQTKGDERIPVSLAMTIIGQEDLQSQGSLYIARDIRARREAENDRKVLEEKLRQSEKMQAIGQLAGGIAHDFNNQLTGIMGYADLLKRKLSTDETLPRYIDSMQMGIRHAAELTGQLLAFARKGKFLTVPVDVHKAINEVVSLLQHSIDKRIRIKQVLLANPALTLGDPTQLQNALLNIALNARDAMPQGGDITFTTDIIELTRQYCEKHSIEVTPGRYLQINITDTGTGIPQETLRHIFEPFFTTKEQGKGTGMGLAAVYGTIKNHRGAIQVLSAVGHGTTFKLFLPHQPTKDTGKLREFLEQPVSGTATIMLVDDEEVVCQMASEMLKELGYSVVVCKNGKDACALYEKQWQYIDCVILDMVMPEMNGLETYKVLRSINANVRVILSSGYSIEGEAQKIVNDGHSIFVQKPYSMVALSKSLHSMIKSRK